MLIEKKLARCDFGLRPSPGSNTRASVSRRGSSPASGMNFTVIFALNSTEDNFWLDRFLCAFCSAHRDTQAGPHGRFFVNSEDQLRIQILFG